MNLNNKVLALEEPAIPCGLVAKSVFNDDFNLLKKNADGTYTNINIKNDNIAWSSDVEYKFKNIQDKYLPDNVKD